MSAGSNIGRRLEIVACLLDHEARAGRGLGVVSVAERLQRQKSQISRALRSLAEAGLVERDAETLEFTVGESLLAVAACAGRPDLLRRASPIILRLAADIGERVELTVLRDRHVLTVDTAPGPSTVQSAGWSGRLTPVHCTASGRVLTMDSSPQALRDLLGDDPLPAAGPASPTTLAVLIERVGVARQTGAAIADGELEADLVAVAAPIRDGAGAVTAAVSISGPSFRLRPHLQRAESAVRRAAADLSDLRGV